MNDCVILLGKGFVLLAVKVIKSHMRSFGSA